MSVVGHSPPPFFKRGIAPLARLAIFASLSIFLLIVDLRFQTLDMLRATIATAIYPLQQLAYRPVEFVGGAGKYFASLAALQAENAELRDRQLSIANRLLRQEQLELENRRLRALLDMSERQPTVGQIGDILYAARDPFSRRIVIDKGMQQNIAAGQVVVDERGVIGQVTRVFPLISEVTLLTDKNQAIPVQVQRNGIRAILAGAGAGLMELRFMPANAEIEVGDTLVTSGLDGVYLPGLPVAKVVKIDRDAAYTFARILCEPIGGVERNGQVLVLATRPMSAPQPADMGGGRDDAPAQVRRIKRGQAATEH
ncbi:MAG TPA: rod shape-determining protein MreC [Rhodocyclaceae bacterium]|nr:rod shape-determining protein MreC [Rhodocyclaceae bacterium]